MGIFDHSVVKPVTVAEIITELEKLLPHATIRPDSDLIAVGFDSLRIMRFSSLCRKAGFTATFADFLVTPQPQAWVELLNSTLPKTQPQEAQPQPTDAEPEETFRLAPLQHAYWAGGFNGNLGGISAHLYVELDGKDHDPVVLEQAISQLVARHEMLRVQINNDGTQQILASTPSNMLSVVDLRHASADHISTTLESIRTEMSSRRTGAQQGKMLDIRLSRLPDNNARLHVDFDMLAGDAMSYRIMLDDLAALVGGETLTPITTSFRQYLAADSIVNPPHRDRDKQWWTSRLSDLPDPPKLPTYPNIAAHTIPPQRRQLFLDSAQRFALQEHAHNNAVTPAACLATAFAHAIGAYATQSRFLLNVPLFHREHILPGIEQVVGDFSSSVLVSVDLSSTRSIHEHIQSLSDNMHQSIQHSDWSALDILRDLSRERGSQIIAPIVYTSAVGLGELFSTRVRETFGDPVWILSEGPQVLLDAQVTELDGGFLVNWDVREGMFLPGVVDGMFEAYRRNVEALITDSDWTSPFPQAVPPAQLETRRQTETARPSASDALLHRKFFELAEKHPEKPAVLWDNNGKHTYGELHQKALKVAALLHARGVRQGDIVGVRIAKGPDQVTALLGILAAGAAWVPLGSDQPAARRRHILKQANSSVVLHDKSVLSDLDSEVVNVLLFDAYNLALDVEKLNPLAQSTDDLAYVLFTSGSTGEPKGVEITHRAVMNTIDSVNALIGLAEDDRTLGLSSLEFDLSVQDIFAPLNTGGAIVTLTESERRDADAWCELIATHHVTQLYCVPPLLDMLLSATSTADLHSLRWCLLGGDWVTLDLPVRLRDRVPHCRFAGLGGATETAIHSTFYEVTDPSDLDPLLGSVPFGVPLANMQARIVDDSGNDRPDFVPGEYQVAGPGIARGYRNDSALTELKFPYIDGQRWYRTNDLARYLADGTIEFLGRRDDQVKIRGYRIEIGEVEAAIRATPGVTAAVVSFIDRVDRPPYLGAVITVEQPTTTTKIRQHIQELLPPYMIPEVMLPVAALPVNSNGKHDRKTCAELIVHARAEQATQVPTPLKPGSLEALIAKVFADVIGSDPDGIGADDDFIQLGGNSVLTTKAMSILRDLLDYRQLPALLLFESRTPRSLAAALRLTEPETGLFDRTAEILHELNQGGDLQ